MKKQNIIEKLGITPGPWIKDYGMTNGHIKSTAFMEEGRTPTVCRYDSIYEGIISDSERDQNAKLIAAAPEMLEALIMITKWNFQTAKDKYGDESKAYNWSCVKKALPVIEKATGRTWEEIKGLIDEP